MDLDIIEKCLNITAVSIGIIGSLYGFWKWLEPRISQSNGSSQSYTSPPPSSSYTAPRSSSSTNKKVEKGVKIGELIGMKIGGGAR